MAEAQTTRSKMAAVKGSTWGTAVALGSGHRFPILTTDLDGVPGKIADDTLQDTAEQARPNNDVAPVTGGYSAITDYRQRLLLWALFFGQAGVPTTVEAATRFRHVFPWQANTDGLFATVGRHNDVGSAKAWRFASLKPGRLQLSGSAGGRVEETMEFMGGGIERDQNPSTWDYANDPAGGGARHVLFRAGVMRMNAQSGGALGAGDKLSFYRGFSLDANRSLNHEFEQDGASAEPVQEGFATLTMRYEFFGADEALFDLLRDAFENETPMKSDVVFTGPALGAGNYELRLYMPELIVAAGTQLPITQPGRVPFSVDFTLHRAAAVPTGFPATYQDALTVDMVNGISTDPLA